MTTENSMNNAAAATISEKELWAAFLTLTFTNSITTSAFKGSANKIFCPAEHVFYIGECISFGAISEIIADSLEISEEPSNTLCEWIDDLEVHVSNLKAVRAAFWDLQLMAKIMPPEPEPELWRTDPAAYKAWEAAANESENNPRYRAPICTSEQGEAA